MRTRRLIIGLLVSALILVGVVAPALAGPINPVPNQAPVIQDIGGIGELLGLLAGISFLVEAVVELTVASWLWKGNQEMIDTREMVLKLVTSAIGVGLAWGYNIDLIGAVADIFGVAPTNPMAMQLMGNILTGILVGRGAQWFHDMGSAWLGLDGNIPSIVQVGAVPDIDSGEWPEQ